MPRQKSPKIDLELDLGRYELRRQGRRIRLEKKPMELLILLASRRDLLVTREEIVAKLWRSALFIDTEPNINNIVRKIRTALGDSSERPRFLETVVGKGYRFVGPLRLIAARSASTGRDAIGVRAAEQDGPHGRTDRSSLAVLPLTLVGKVMEDHGICLGFADALITRLGNLSDIDVLPTSAVINVPEDTPPTDTAARLGVRFLVHGAIQVLKGQWRLSLEVLDTQLRTICFKKKCDLDVGRLSDMEDQLATQISVALHRPLLPAAELRTPRYSKIPVAYAEFMRGYRLSSSGDPGKFDEAAQHLGKAVTLDPAFALAHATLSVVCASRHFEVDPSNVWLEKAEFHCRRSLELNPELPESHVASAFLLWGPSKNFQHLEAIAELKHALALQNNLPQAYNRLGTILAHIGLLDQSREMYERARSFHPRKAISHSVVQAYMWSEEYDLAREEIEKWHAENPANKYAVYFAARLAMVTEELPQSRILLEEALRLAPEEPLFLSLQGLYHAMTGSAEAALDAMTAACSTAKSFGHAHHSYYQIACILALLDKRAAAFEWLERSVSTGFACWPFFLKDPTLSNLRRLPQFEALVTSLRAKYPNSIGQL
ncbi:MAG TPA: winged helix-turn-helix domain-containing protein [Candidatus Acidoferrum sp.]|nr:winged helix-turn-helix domain-containing protein [Candidatus Acidoferrum sp.]